MKWRSRIRALVVVSLIATAVILPAPAKAEGPLRSGTIVGGYVVFLSPPPCFGTPDCAAWLAADCDPTLTGRDPAVFTSIVEVREFAGTERTLWMGRWLSGAVEFWSEDCRLGAVPWRSPGYLGATYPHSPFRVPDGAYWMSITAGAPVHWELW